MAAAGGPQRARGTGGPAEHVTAQLSYEVALEQHGERYDREDVEEELGDHPEYGLTARNERALDQDEQRSRNGRGDSPPELPDDLEAAKEPSEVVAAHHDLEHIGHREPDRVAGQSQRDHRWDPR